MVKSQCYLMWAFNNLHFSSRNKQFYKMHWNLKHIVESIPVFHYLLDFSDILSLLSCKKLIAIQFCISAYGLFIIQWYSCGHWHAAVLYTQEEACKYPLEGFPLLQQNEVKPTYPWLKHHTNLCRLPVHYWNFSPSPSRVGGGEAYMYFQYQWVSESFWNSEGLLSNPNLSYVWKVPQDSIQIKDEPELVFIFEV